MLGILRYLQLLIVTTDRAGGQAAGFVFCINRWLLGQPTGEFLQDFAGLATKLSSWLKDKRGRLIPFNMRRPWQEEQWRN
jgi:hypothetical protein